MREFKFRAWDNVENEMLYAGEDTDVIFTLGSEGIQCTDIRNVMPSGEGVEFPEHYIYMQYTGLKDKNSKEIYEGDIININISEYRIYYASQSASYRAEDLETGWHFDLQELFPINYWEVIGNVYEGGK